jgi:hypothetical protein
MYPWSEKERESAICGAFFKRVSHVASTTDNVNEHSPWIPPKETTSILLEGRSTRPTPVQLHTLVAQPVGKGDPRE